MIKFNLKTWQENPNLKVVTRDGVKVNKIRVEGIYVRGEVKSIDSTWTWYEDGRDSMFATSEYDLFFAYPEPEEEMYVTIFKEKLCSGIHYSLEEAKKYYIGNNPIYKLTKVTE